MFQEGELFQLVKTHINIHQLFSVIRWGFPFQYNPKNLDPSYKTALDFFEFYWQEKHLKATCRQFWLGKTEIIMYRIFFIIRLKFSLLKQSQNVDPSYKTDLDFWHCSCRVEYL